MLVRSGNGQFRTISTRCERWVLCIACAAPLYNASLPHLHHPGSPGKRGLSTLFILHFPWPGLRFYLALPSHAQPHSQSTVCRIRPDTSDSQAYAGSVRGPSTRRKQSCQEPGLRDSQARILRGTLARWLYTVLHQWSDDDDDDDDDDHRCRTGAMLLCIPS